ncbi:response regulator transcription factor [Mucilaginibacter limnophilus]|uniref:Response regulator transcription factor n=1 Tax=Mucilaginibacter limnophilus TaxID=1932778 RepID=A0A3S3TFA3_9SPHI|nr:response regulator transcription factor [Mucilaginibacter limnophilus]RVT98504.1 response regulator transcription factor [Mucilaginibacter limnophilus]
MVNSPFLMMKVLVVDDHQVVREGLCQLLSAQPDMEVVANAADGRAALDLLNDGLQLNLLLTDMNMPGMDGLELTRRSTKLRRGLRVIVLTLHPLLAVKPRVLAAGAKDCVSKDGSIDELLTAIRAVHAVPNH